MAAEPKQPQQGIGLIEAVGSGPADETVIVSELFVRPGQEIARGDVVAALEATKSVFELTSPVSGTIEELCVAEGDTVAVGAPLAQVRTGTEATTTPTRDSGELRASPSSGAWKAARRCTCRDAKADREPSTWASPPSPP